MYFLLLSHAQGASMMRHKAGIPLPQAAVVHVQELLCLSGALFTCMMSSQVENCLLLKVGRNRTTLSCSVT